MSAINKKGLSSVDDKDIVHVVSFSGGRTSAYLVYLMEQRRIKEGLKVHYIFMDTGAEHPLTYTFLKQVVEHFNIELTVIRCKVNPKMGVGVTYEVIPVENAKCDLKPWKDFIKKYGEPTINAPRCTSRMKTEPHDKYCDERWGKNNYITWLGIRADEPRRLKHFDLNQDLFSQEQEFRPIRYLAELSNFGKQDILDWWATQPFDLQIPEHLGNCVFCIKKAQPKLILAVQDEPELADEFIDMLSSPDNRRLPKAVHVKNEIYRGHMSLDKIVKLSKVIPHEDVKASVKERIALEEDNPTMCSESCEVFGSAPLSEDDA